MRSLLPKLVTVLFFVNITALLAGDPPAKSGPQAIEKSSVADQPVFSCAMPAYLFQGSPTDAYSVNLSTGQTTLVKNNLIGPGIGGRQIQAVGYNVIDNYLWGYRSGTDQLVRIGGDWSVQFFTITGLAVGAYDVGDIDANGIMYLSSGSSVVKRIDLNPSSPTYLQALSDLTTTGTTIADWAVNVVDGNIYAINQSSLLLRYNTTTGVRTTLGVVQWSVTTGTGFGAAYSDSEGNLYVQDNQGGKIFKIDKPHLLPASTTAQIAGNLFAVTGMTTSSNDGTRCMNAPPPCQAPTRPDGVVTSPDCITITGTISLTSPVGADIQYNINGGVYQTAPQFSGLIPGSYTITAKNVSTGCVSLANSFTVNAIPASPSSPTASVVPPTCLTQTGTITVTSPTTGVDYSFDNGSTYQSGNAKSGLASGVYLVKVRSMASGCESGPVSVTVSAAPAIPASPTASVVQPTCTVPTGTITVTSPSVGVAYSFDNGSTYQSGNAKSGLSAGVYQVKVGSTASGCESGPVSVTVSAAPAVPATPTASVIQPTCLTQTGTITVTSPTTGVEYSFDNGSTYQSGNATAGLAAGVYQVKVRSTVSGCESGPVSVTVSAAPTVPATPTASVVQPTCLTQTGTITVTSPSAGVDYSFDNGSTYQSGNAKAGLASDVYQVKVRSMASGCESGSLSVTVNAAPTVPTTPTTSVIQPTCLTQTGTITVTSPLTGVEYSFDNGSTYQSGNAKAGLPAGTYQVKVRSTASGCESGPLSVTVNAAPTVPAMPTASVVPPTCLTQTGTITVTSPSAGVAYSFDNGSTYQSGNAKAGLASGVYQVKVRSTVSGCESGPVNMTVNAAPVVPATPTASVVQPTCLTQTGTITVTSPSAGVAYSFDNGSTYQSGNAKAGLASGVYQVKVRSTVSGCESGPVSVTVNAAPVVPASPTVSVIQPTCTVSTGTITVTSPSAGVDYSFDNGSTYQSGNAKAGLAWGVYQIKVRSTVSGCESGPVSVTVSAALAIPATPTASVIQPTCLTQTGTITVTSPTTGVEYSFDNGSTYQSGNAKASLSTGVYLVKVRSKASGCESGSLSVTVNAAPTVPTTPTTSVVQPTCLTQTGTITVTSPLTGVDYSFDNGSTYQPGNVKSGLASGVYLVKVRSTVPGCESGPVNMTVSAAPVVPATPTASVVQPTCLTQTGTITVTSPLVGVEYSFDDGSTYQSGNAKSGLAAGVYQIKVRSTASGCEAGPVSVTVSAAPAVPATPTASVVQPTCLTQTGTITVTSPTTGVEYSFDNGSTYQSGNAKAGLASGVYQVKVRSTVSGCESGPVSVTVSAAPAIPASPTASVIQPTCAVLTGTITVTSPTTGVAYSFDNGSTYQPGNTKAGLASGVYQVKVRSTASRCESGPLSVTVSAAPLVPAIPTAGVVHPTCLTQTGTITVTSPSVGVAYSFDNGSTYQSGNAKAGLASGVYQVKVRSTASGCESGPLSVTVSAVPLVPATPTTSVVQPTCLTQTGTITVTSPSVGVEYSFDNGMTYPSGNAKAGLASGVYLVKVRSTVSGCESGPLSVTVSAAPVVPATPTTSVIQPTCAVLTGTITVTSPTTGVEYSFDNGSMYQSGNAKAGLASGVYLVKVRSTVSGCESGPVSVTVSAAPAVPATPTASLLQPTCTVPTGTITVTSPLTGVEYSFDNGSTYQPGNAKAGLASGVYLVKVRSTVSGCEVGPVSVTVNAVPTVPATPTVSVIQPTCAVLTGTITVTSPSVGVEYSFDNGSTYQSGNAKAGLASGVYLVKVRSTVSGCESGSLSVTVNTAPTVPAIPTASVVQPTCLTQTGTITVTSPSAGVAYSFDNGSTYQPGNAKAGLAWGVYQVKVRSTASGCESGPLSVTVDAAPAVPAMPMASVLQPTCTVSTGTIIVTSPSVGVEYSFDNGSTYQSGNATEGLASGVYQVKVRSTVSGCESGPLSVTVSAAPAIPASPTVSVVQPTCTVPTGTITVTSPSVGVAYSFDDGSMYQSGNAKAGLASGVYLVKVRSTVSGCESGPLSVTVNAAPTVPATPTASVIQPTCLTQTGTITVTSPLTGVDYSFDNGSTYQSGNAKSGLASGVYLVKVRSTASGCESVSVSVTVNAAPAIPAMPTASVVQPTCLTQTGTITVTSPSAGVAYSFDNGSTYQSGNAKSGLASGVYSVKVRSTASGCESGPLSVTVNVAPLAPAIPTAGVVHPTCLTQTGTITVISPSVGVECSFDNGSTYQSGNAKAGLASGVYSVKVRSSASGCESGPVSVTVNAAPLVPAAPMVSVIQPTCLTLTGRVEFLPSPTPVFYSFNGGADFQDTPVKSVVSPGTVLILLVKHQESGCLSTPLSVTIDALGNCPPIANPNAGTVLTGSSLTGNLIADDQDPEAGVLQITQIVVAGVPYNRSGTEPIQLTMPGVGTLTVGVNGDYTFLPAPRFTGLVPPIGYTVMDESGAIASSTLSLVIVKTELRLITPLYDCTSGALTVKTTGGDGTSVEWQAVGITGWTTNLTATVPQELRDDPKTIILYARQSDYVTSFTFDMVAACGDCLPGPGKPLRIKTPVLLCKDSKVCLSVCGGDGSAIRYKIDEVSEWNNDACVMVGDDLVHRDPKVLFIRVRQGEQQQVFEYNLPLASAACPDSTRPWNQRVPTTPAPPSVTVTIPGSPTGNTGRTIELLEPLYSCVTGVITFRYQGGDGSPVEFMAVGITGWTTQPIHHVEDALRLEQPQVLIYARQAGTLVSYLFDLKGYCQKASVPILPPSVTVTEPVVPVSFSLLAPSYDCRTGQLRFNVTGANDGTVEFMAIGITGWTTQRDHVLDNTIRQSGESVLLFARCQGVVVSLRWNPAQACQSPGREAITSSRLQIRLLENPVTQHKAQVWLTGYSPGKEITIRCYDAQGRLVSTSVMQPEGGPVSVLVDLGQSPGLYIISVQSQGQQVQMKAVKP